VEEFLATWARELGATPAGDEAAFVVMPLARLADSRGEVLDESLDPAIAASLGPEDRDWLLERLPPSRRTAVLGRLRGAYALRRLLHLGDAHEVARQIVARAATRPPGHTMHTLIGGDLLRALGPAAAAPLRAALEAGDVADPGLFADVLAELDGRAEHLVTVRAAAGGLILRLSTPDGEELADVAVPRHPKRDDLAPLMAALPRPDQARLFLQPETDVDDSTVYRLQRLLAEFPMRSVSTKGSTFMVTRPQ
jgi:hypothetical protein